MNNKRGLSSKKEQIAVVDEPSVTRLQQTRRESQESDMSETLLSKSTDNVQSITDSGVDMNSAEMLQGYNSDDVTGEENMDSAEMLQGYDSDVTGASSSDDETGGYDSDVTGASSSDDATGGYDSDVTGASSSDDAIGEESLLNDTDTASNESGSRVNAQKMRHASNQDGSGTDGDPNPRKKARYDSRKHRKVALSQQHRGTAISGSSQEPVPPHRSLQKHVPCPICNRSMSIDNLIQHLNKRRGLCSKTDHNFRCPTCEMQCHCALDFNAHCETHRTPLAAARSDPSDYVPCPICNISMNRANLKQHLNKQKGPCSKNDHNFRCPTCEMQCHCALDFIAHCETHNTPLAAAGSDPTDSDLLQEKRDTCLSEAGSLWREGRQLVANEPHVKIQRMDSYCLVDKCYRPMRYDSHGYKRHLERGHGLLGQQADEFVKQYKQKFSKKKSKSADEKFKWTDYEEVMCELIAFKFRESVRTGQSITNTQLRQLIRDTRAEKRNYKSEKDQFHFLDKDPKDIIRKFKKLVKYGLQIIQRQEPKQNKRQSMGREHMRKWIPKEMISRRKMTSRSDSDRKKEGNEGKKDKGKAGGK